MSDCISRQAAQDYIAKYLSQFLYDDVREAVETIDEYIGDMPSVTPTDSVIEDIKAEIKDLHNSHMINFVSADGAVDTCLEIIDKHIVTPTERTGHWIDAIEPIPLEERDAKLGITYKNAGYKCSECGAKHEEHRLSMIATKTNYCPNCGCRMVEPQERSE